MPMMLFSGIMSMVMFGSMMGFMGMAMNPAESAQTEGQVDDSGGAGADDSGDASDTGASDTGASDTGDTGGFSDMGADSGMDTGGFDSF
jgi:hypothetical protein